MTQRATMETDELHPTLGIPWQRLPRHIAIIMDGNGRWAQQRGRPRIEGHQNGSRAVRATITEAARLQIECLTLYSFSTENWKRPPAEVAGLMDLYEQYLINERPTIMQCNIKVRHLGDRTPLPPHVIAALDETIEKSKNNTGMTLCLALNYSGRSEILRAIEQLANQCKAGQINPDQIDEALVNNSLDTHGLPDPDLLIRTAGERRISNFLLWQISYAELFVTDSYWPDFGPPLLREAILDYAKRSRRFGGLKPSDTK